MILDDGFKDGDLDVVSPGDEVLFAALVDGLSPQDQQRLLVSLKRHREQERRADSDDTPHLRGGRL